MMREEQEGSRTRQLTVCEDDGHQRHDLCLETAVVIDAVNMRSVGQLSYGNADESDANGEDYRKAGCKVVSSSSIFGSRRCDGLLQTTEV